ncbi:MAG: hypothetical protein ACRCXB_08895 [Aeromonadaceae bacterium]
MGDVKNIEYVLINYNAGSESVSVDSLLDKFEHEGGLYDVESINVLGKEYRFAIGSEVDTMSFFNRIKDKVDRLLIDEGAGYEVDL